jgi:hypothetical protein
MHIRENEATDSIDWEYFYAGEKPWQPKAWGLLHDTVQNIPCSTCRDEAISLMKAMHDLVTYYVHPGRKLFDEANFLEIAERYSAAAKHLKAEGTIPHMEHEIVL